MSPATGRVAHRVDHDDVRPKVTSSLERLPAQGIRRSVVARHSAPTKNRERSERRPVLLYWLSLQNSTHNKLWNRVNEYASV